MVHFRDVEELVANMGGMVGEAVDEMTNSRRCSHCCGFRNSTGADLGEIDGSGAVCGHYFPMASSSAIASAGSSSSAAATFSRRWSTEVVPGISTVVGDRWSSQAKATC